MLGFRFVRFGPMAHVLHYRRGKVVREGPGLSFFYYAPTSSIVAVPLGSIDLPFIFNEVTADFQTLAVQGQLTYKVVAPRQLAEVLDFSVDAHGRPATDSQTKLDQRLVNEVQMATADRIQKTPLREAVRSAAALSRTILDGLAQAPAVTLLGVQPLGVTISSIQPNPETARALEAEAREALLQEADLAVYARRNTAVEQERRIKESELNTEIAVEEKKRQIREVQVGADIAVEERRKELLVVSAENRRKEADTQGYALERVLAPLSGVDWRHLLVLQPRAGNPATVIALAFKELAENAAKIGSLNISPELLETLLKQGGADAG
jgi:SPFH domain/Band 7 family protein